MKKAIIIFLIIIIPIITLLIFSTKKVDSTIQGPGLGWHRDYAHVDSQGVFIGIESFPQSYKQYPSN